MNGDRHHMNIAHDKHTERVEIFDHSHAFLRPNGYISARLALNAKELCIENHCLASEINHQHGLEPWMEKIKLIPDYFIKEVIQSTVDLGLPAQNSNECMEFMIDRKAKLNVILSAHMDKFPKLPGAKA
jgi:hypothetical protein